jgi:hypothetical protein
MKTTTYILALKENKHRWEHLWGPNGEYPKEPLPRDFANQVNTWLRGYEFALLIHNIKS